MFRTLFVAALGCFCACAQETVHLASISGTVSDTTGAVLITAQIAARNVATNTTVSMVTDREGTVPLSIPPAWRVRATGSPYRVR